MSADWQEFSLTDLYEISSGLSKSAEFFGSGYPFLSFKEVFGNYFLPESLSQLVESSEKERQSGSIKRGDVFLTRTSETMHELGMSSVALKDYPNATFNGFTKRLRPKEPLVAEIHPEFMGYCLRSPTFRKSMLAFSTMSTRASLNNDMISRLKIKLPEIQKQKGVAKILHSLDKKIHLNTQTNQTLESIAQAIFKSWFVDFEPVKAKMAAKERWYAMQPTSESASPVCYADEAALPDLETYTNLAAMCAISGKNETELAQLQQQNPDQYQQLTETAALFPSAMVDSELGEIPEGWEVKSVSDFGNIVCGKTPSKSEARYFGPGIPFIKIPDMHNEIYVVNPTEELSLLGADSQKKKTIPAGSICVSCIATVGKVVLTQRPSQTNQQINSIVPRNPEFTFYLYFQMKSKEQEFHDLASGGSATLNMNTSTFSKINVLLPTLNSIKAFDSCVKSIFNRVLTTQIESKELAELRDALLPKLLSGEIEVMEIK